MIIETERLTLRPWEERDAESLYEYAKDPRVGPAAGWEVHTSVDNSREIIKTVLSAEGTYAVTLKGQDRAIGSVGIMMAGKSNIDIPQGEAEIGYWIGVPYWGQGLIPEAVEALLALCFTKLGCSRVWCGYFEGNEKSKRCMEKCGFRYHHTNPHSHFPAREDVEEHFTIITREQWLERQGQK